MLHLVGETIDKHRAHAGAQSGDLISLYRGIYVDAGDAIDQMIIDHAVRIAVYLYPRAYLSGASAATLGPDANLRLFLSDRRNDRTRIRGLEIVRNQAPPRPSTVQVLVGDDLGELTLTASSPRQQFLEAFRRRSEHANAIGPDLKRQMAERLLEEFGSAGATADALFALAEQNGWQHEAEAAQRYLRTDLQALRPAVNQAAVAFTVAWHGEVIGHLSHDGAEWRWASAEGRRPPLVRETRPGSLPPFIESLLPEGWLAEVLAERGERGLLRTGKRYLSNITVAPDAAELATLPADVLQGRLSAFQTNGRFTGRYQGPGQETFEEKFQENLARLFAFGTTPRLSGVQIKAPMTLLDDGDLIPATETPFTHILKPAGSSGFETLPIVEWTGLTLARAAGFEAPEAALVEMPDGLPPALLVERFDIRRTDNDTRRIAMEDFCSVLDVPAENKYDGTIERMARAMRPLSTNFGADLETLFGRAVFAWLIADGDMHLKNLALLKIAEPGEDHFGSVRFAPVYDTVTTQVFPRLEHDRMALKLNGKDDRLAPDDFLTLARTVELSQTRANILMAQIARRLVEALPGVALPEPFDKGAGQALDRVKAIVARRTEPFV
nr:type II toxin-antitoxin system HipA family toxin [Brevundimonas diminuta]